jgi:hypothetical protein
MSTTSVQFRLKRRTTAEWETAPILANGEPGFETTTGQLKIGNGTSTWDQLPYVSDVPTDTAANLGPLVLTRGELAYATNTKVLKIGDGTNTFTNLPALLDVDSIATSVTSAQSASASAGTARDAALTALGATVVTGSQTADTIAAGRALVADNAYFIVRPVAASGLTRFTVYKRTSANQDVVGSVASGAEVDEVKNDYIRVGGNLITNSTFALNIADSGAYTTPVGYAYGNNAGGGKIVTRPNTAIDSINALQFDMLSNASSGGFPSSLVELQLQPPTITVPTSLVSTGGTVRLIYSLQLTSGAAAISGITNVVGSACSLRIENLNITSAVGSAGVITYTCASQFLIPVNTTQVSISGLPVTSGASLNVTGTIATVAGDKLSFTINNAAVGTSIGSATVLLAINAYTSITRGITATANVWQQVVTDTSVPPGITSIILNARLRNATISPANTTPFTVFLTGMCGVLNRPNLFNYDANFNERAATETTASREQLNSPWTIGTNVAPNSLVNIDPIGTNPPTGYVAISSAVIPVRSIQSCPLTPFNTNVAWRSTHTNDGSTRTDGQYGFSVSVPTALRDIAFTMRCIYYTYIQDARITSTIVTPYRNGDLGSQTGVSFTKISVDGAVNTWFPVVHNIAVTAVSGTNSIFIRLRQQGGVTSSGWGGGVSAYAWITGISVGFNRTNTIYDRNLTSEITTIARAEASNRQVMNQADQYIDSNGMMSPVLPIEQIVSWGDSLTAAGYITNVITSFTSAGVIRTGLNNGIGGETSTQILDRVNGYSFSGPSGTYNANTEVILRARRAQPNRLTDVTYLSEWTKFGSTIAEPRFVNFYTSGTLIGTSYTRLSAVSDVTTGSSTLTAVGHPFVTGDIVHFLTSSPASLTAATVTKTNIFRAKHYFVTKVNNNTYTIRQLTGDNAVSDAVVFNAPGTVTALGDFTLSWTPAANTASSTITTRTYTNTDTSTAVLWMGANNIDQVTIVQADIASAVSHFKTLGKRVIIMTPIIAIGDGSPAGSPGTPGAAISLAPYNPLSQRVVNRNTIGTWILNTYPNNSIDILQVLQAGGNNSVGDNEDIANGGTPRSLRYDLIHPNAAGDVIIANAVYNLLTANKW